MLSFGYFNAHPIIDPNIFKFPFEQLLESRKLKVEMLISGAVVHGFGPWSGQTKHYKIGICCFLARHATFRRKSKDWLDRNKDTVSDWAKCISTDCCFSEPSTIKIQISIENDLDIKCSWRIAELVLNNNHSLTKGRNSKWHMVFGTFCALHTMINILFIFIIGSMKKDLSWFMFEWNYKTNFHKKRNCSVHISVIYSTFLFSIKFV